MGRRWSDPWGSVRDRIGEFEMLFEALDLQGPGRVIPRRRAAQLCNRSEATLKRHFRRLTGRTWRSFVHEWQMENGRRWLQAPFVSLKEVALACGYGSARAFSRAYFNHFGLRPRRDPASD